MGCENPQTETNTRVKYKNLFLLWFTIPVADCLDPLLATGGANAAWEDRYNPLTPVALAGAEIVRVVLRVTLITNPVHEPEIRSQSEELLI
jgi:hypothetical protein